MCGRVDIIWFFDRLSRKKKNGLDGIFPRARNSRSDAETVMTETHRGEDKN